MTTDNFDPSTALIAYYTDRSTTRPARLWSREVLLHVLEDFGSVEFFEGGGSDPTVLTGYDTGALWLRVDAGVTDAVGTIRYYAGGTASSLSSWPELTRAGFAAHIGALGGSLDYVWSASTSGDPTTGKLLGNSATIASITAINISKTGRGGQSYGSIIGSYDDSTNTVRGYLRIYGLADAESYLDLIVSGAITDNSTYVTIPVTYVAGAGFTAGQLVGVGFTRSGDSGGASPTATTRSSLKAIATSNKIAILTEPGFEGLFSWDAIVPTTIHQADTEEYNYIAPSSGSAGAWVRTNNADRAVTVETGAVQAALKGKQDKLDVVSELPTPATAGFAYQALVTGSSTSVAHVMTDGTNYFDIGAGGLRDPWWLPPGATLFADFDNSRFYWDGASKTIGDMTANGDGSYTINTGAWWASGATYMIDYTTSGTAIASGNLFSWTNASNQRLEFEMSSAGGVSPDIKNTARLLYSPPATTTSAFEYNSPASVSQTIVGDGWHRVVAVVENGSVPLQCVDNTTPESGTSTAVGTFTIPTAARFSGRQRFADQPLTNATLKRVVVWNRSMTETEINRLGQWGLGKVPPIHFIGDSFLNLYVLQRKIRDLVSPAKYIGFSQDGVGSTSLTQQAVRYAAYTSYTTKWWNSTLIIMDGGFDGTGPEAIAAIKSMLSYMTHDRWLYIESNPQDATGTANRTAWEIRNKQVRGFCGTQHYIPTLATIQAAGTGTGADATDVANGIWPTSLRADATHLLDPGGYQVMAGIIYSALSSRGWI